MPKLTIAEIEALMQRVFPESVKFARIEALGDQDITLRLPLRDSLIRPGGTVSGPAMMTLADTAAYFLVLALDGAVQAVTSSLDIHFLARPAQADLLATARMLKLGRRLAVTTVEIRSEGGTEVVAHATVTYALPTS